VYTSDEDDGCTSDQDAHPFFPSALSRARGCVYAGRGNFDIPSRS
jgi:hypothetical protein